MASVERTLALKIVTFRTQRKDFSPPDIARILRKAKNAELPVEQKHVPEIAKLKKGKRGAFVNKITDLGKDKGVIAEICSYLHGVFPETGTVPLGQAEIDLDAAQAQASSAGLPNGEAFYRFRALFIGQAVIVEKASNTSGIQVLPQVLKVVMRNLLNDSTYPVPHLVNVGSNDLSNIISSKGGVEKVVASLAVKNVKPAHRFAALLSKSRNGIKGADRIQVSWFSDSADLSVQDVDEIYEEFDEDGELEGVKLIFPGGTSVTDLRRYREQDRVDVEADSRNRPYASSVHEALKDYSARLRDPGREGPLDVDGKLRTGYYLAGSDDEN